MKEIKQKIDQQPFRKQIQYAEELFPIHEITEPEIVDYSIFQILAGKEPIE